MAATDNGRAHNAVMRRVVPPTPALQQLLLEDAARGRRRAGRSTSPAGQDRTGAEAEDDRAEQGPLMAAPRGRARGTTIFTRCDEFDTSSVLPANDTAVGASYRVANDTGKRR